MTLPDLPPALSSGGVFLRGFEPGDADAVFGYLNDPALREHTSIPAPTPESVAASIASSRRSYADRTSCKLAVALAPDGPAVGGCGFTNWSLDHGWAELTYELSSGHWGKGVMSAAVDLVLRWAFETAGFNRVHAVVMDTNQRSERLLGRAAFVLEGTLRQYRVCRGAHRDFRMYSLLAADWTEGAKVSGRVSPAPRSPSATRG